MLLCIFRIETVFLEVVLIYLLGGKMSENKKTSFADIQKNFFSVNDEPEKKQTDPIDPSFFDFAEKNPEAILIAGGCCGGSGDGGSSGSDPSPAPK